jgi:MOSC domain-containing protein YiiM
VSGASATLRELRARFAQAGRVAWIGLRPARRGDMQIVERADVTATGLVGDRQGRDNARAVTLIQQEHLPVIAALAGREAVGPELLRRNLAVCGINLIALRGSRVTIGTAVLEITDTCAPCSRMEAALGTGGYSAMRGHGGVTARVIVPGGASVGDAVCLAG